MLREIGSDFELEWEMGKRAREGEFFFLDKDTVFLESGRSALRCALSLMNAMSDSFIALPAYLCPELIPVFKEKEIEYAFYPINRDLIADPDDVKKLLNSRKTSAMMLIHYFGFPQPYSLEIARLAKEREVILFEDCAQSLLTKSKSMQMGRVGDFSFTSFRKTLPLPDGASLSINNIELKKKVPRFEEDPSYLTTRLQAMVLKRIYRTNAIADLKTTFRTLFLQSEEMLNQPGKIHMMSEISRSLLFLLPFQIIIQRRRENFNYLLSHLSSDDIKPIYNHLADGVCPLGFPVLLDKRDVLKAKLIEQSVYPPVHWRLWEELLQFPSSVYLANRILTIPIDQRCNNHDLARILEVSAFRS